MSVLYQFIKQYYIPILIALISKIIVLFIIAELSTNLIVNSRASNLNIWQLWNVWDAPHYISVAEFGYQKLGDEANFIILLPLFPLSIFLLKFLFNVNYLVSGYLSSFMFSILLSIVLYKLVLIDYPKRVANMTILMLFIFPTSFFLHIPYTEPLFISLTVSSFYFVRRQRYWLSFICAGLASATKIAGLALIPALFLEIIIFNKGSLKKNIFNYLNVSLRNNKHILLFGLLISLSGFLVYLTINYYLWGNFFYFTIIQNQHWYERFSPFGQGLIDAFKAISWRSGIDRLMLGYGQIIAFILGLFMSIYVLVKVRISYGLFMIINLFFYYSMSFWICMMRYILTLFPMYLVLAIFSNNKIFLYIWILLSSVLLIILSLIFIQNGHVL
ncbi:hypothetical protein HYW41_03965 [Candidatus Daviesbacteria bacterium]|nr:hypothetical protein [Candidatus Daviesbacteria bacterium]